jgi:hypothetical protein
MTWVRECLDGQQRHQKPAPTLVPTPAQPTKGTWDLIGDAIDAAVHEFNLSSGPRQFDISHMGKQIIQLIPKQLPVNTLKLEVASGVISLVTTISGSGVPRLVKYKIDNDRIIFTGDFTGTPKPRETPMTPDQFSEDVLRPFLFPESK